jgi:hypothetical protein
MFIDQNNKKQKVSLSFFFSVDSYQKDSHFFYSRDIPLKKVKIKKTDGTHSIVIIDLV